MDDCVLRNVISTCVYLASGQVEREKKASNDNK